MTRATTVEEAGTPAIADRVAHLREALAAPPARSNVAVWLFLSLALFLLAGSDNKATDLVILAAVIAIHEGGHALAMKAFGYRDVRVFFIPFFGGAAMGRKIAAPAWQRAAVLFAGPMPGILIGIGLTIFSARTLDVDEARLALEAAVMFIGVNAFNLIPMPPLDGGRLFELALFSRHAVLEIGFALLGSLALLFLAFALDTIALGILAFLLLVGLPTRWRVRRQVDALRATHGTLPDVPADVPATALLALDDAASSLHTPERAHQHAGAVRALWEHLAVPKPSALASVAILAVWLGAVAIGLVGVVFYSLAKSAADGL